jgi:hypothetical protein
MTKLMRKTLADSPMTPTPQAQVGAVCAAAGFGNRLFGHSAAQRELLEKRYP